MAHSLQLKKGPNARSPRPAPDGPKRATPAGSSTSLPKAGHCACGGGCPRCQAGAARLAQSHSTTAPALVNEQALVREVPSQPGRPLDAQTLAFMEPRFGRDLSEVRLHTGVAERYAPRSIGAAAYTVGSHIVMDQAYADTGAPANRQLLAHELAHVVQQGAGAWLQRKAWASEDSAAEREADAASVRVMQGQPAAVRPGSAPAAGTQFGLFSGIKCAYYMWKYSDLQKECRAEYQSACSGDLLSDECQDFMGGAGYPSDAIWNCVGRKNPTALKDFLKNCAKTATGSYGNSKWTQNEGGAGDADGTPDADSKMA